MNDRLVRNGKRETPLLPNIGAHGVGSANRGRCLVDRDVLGDPADHGLELHRGVKLGRVHRRWAAGSAVVPVARRMLASQMSTATVTSTARTGVALPLTCTDPWNRASPRHSTAAPPSASRGMGVTCRQSMSGASRKSMPATNPEFGGQRGCVVEELASSTPGWRGVRMRLLSGRILQAEPRRDAGSIGVIADDALGACLRVNCVGPEHVAAQAGPLMA